MRTAPSRNPPRRIGRYMLHGEIASGGMASVHFGRLLGSVGFARTVAIKRLHPHVARDPDFVSMFLDEARLAARIRHPNVVSTLDVVSLEGELFVVMDYVQGETLSKLLRAAMAKRAPIPVGIAVSVMAGALHGLHAAHEARSERGEDLLIIHRDVSPQNVMVGVDGVARVLDFGVAKAAVRLQTTREGQLKGKLPYMAPEQLRAGPQDRRVDVYAASVVLWELLAGRRLYEGDDAGHLVSRIVSGAVDAPSKLEPRVPKALDRIVLRGLSKNPAMRYPTAREMAAALEKAGSPAPATEVGEWVERVALEILTRRSELLAEIESSSSVQLGASRDTPTNELNASDLVARPSLTSAPSSPSAPSTPSAPSMPSAPATASQPSSPFVPPGVSVPPDEVRASLPSASGPRVPEPPQASDSTPAADRKPDRSERAVVIGSPGAAPPNPRTRAGPFAVAAVAGLFLVSVAAFASVLVLRARRLRPAAEPSAAATEQPAEAPAPSAPGEAVVGSAEPAGSAGAAAPPAAASDPSLASEAPAQPAGAPSTSAGEKKAPPAVKRGPCDPPFTIDKAGIRVPKPQCF